MRAFAYATAETFAAASRALVATPGAVAKAGGIDLLDLQKSRVVEPTELVNLLRAKVEAPAGGLSALATLAEIAADPRLRELFPAVATAAAEAATPQVRTRATLGGNLAQHTRCWYFRDRAFPCTKRGDDRCAALQPGAQTRHHAVLPAAGCASAHPSNLAPALIAVKAQVACTHPDGDRTLDVEALYEAPKAGKLGDTVLRPGELIRGVVLVPSPLAKNSVYLEFRERASYDFAEVAVAAAAEVKDGVVREARVVLGAVAPTPVRAAAAEAAIAGKRLDAATIDAAVAATLADAKPLGDNRHKVILARRLVRRALEALAS